MQLAMLFGICNCKAHNDSQLRLVLLQSITRVIGIGDSIDECAR